MSELQSRERVNRERANAGVSGEGLMTAAVGDWIVLEPVHVGDRRRKAMVIGLRHEDGTPPYLVRWDDSGREGVLSPGANAHILPGHHDDPA